MAKPHKYAGNGLDFETALPIETVANMAQRAAQESTGDLLKGKHRIVSTRSGDRDIEFRINDFLISFKKLMMFTVTFEPRGERVFGHTTIDWYMTSQTTVGGFIPVSSKSMVAHHTYMQFARNLAAQIRQADPTARVTLREGVEGAAGSAPVASAPPVPAAPAPAAVPPPPPAPAAAVPPPPPPPPPPPRAPAAAVPPPPPPPAAPAPPPRVAAPAPSTAGADGLVTGIPGMPVRAADPVPPPAPSPPLLHPVAEAAAQLFIDDEDLDSTRAAQLVVARRWTLSLSDGQTVMVDAPVVVGRAPVAPASSPGARPVPVDDPWRSVSKTHALFEVRDGMLWVTDLHSTHGTSLTNDVGEALACPPGTAMPVGDGWTVSAAEFAIVAGLES